MKVLAVGVGASSELIKGKLQTGVVFQTSWTVGLLLVSTPHSRVWSSNLIGFANRISILSQAKLRNTPSYVPWMNAPRWSVNLPPVNSLTCWKAKLLLGPKWGAAPPGWPASVWVYVGDWSVTANGGPVQSPPSNV